MIGCGGPLLGSNLIRANERRHHSHTRSSARAAQRAQTHTRKGNAAREIAYGAEDNARIEWALLGSNLIRANERRHHSHNARSSASRPKTSDAAPAKETPHANRVRRERQRSDWWALLGSNQ